MSQTKTKNTARKANKPKVRGTLLSILLVIMGLHGALAAYLYYTVRMEGSPLERPWILTLMVVHFLANIVAAVGIWYWKKWGLYVYVGSTILALVVGLLAVGVWSIFYMAFPLIILGYVLRNKWDYFE